MSRPAAFTITSDRHGEKHRGGEAGPPHPFSRAPARGARLLTMISAGWESSTLRAAINRARASLPRQRALPIAVELAFLRHALERLVGALDAVLVVVATEGSSFTTRNAPLAGMWPMGLEVK